MAFCGNGGNANFKSRNAGKRRSKNRAKHSSSFLDCSKMTLCENDGNANLKSRNSENAGREILSHIHVPSWIASKLSYPKARVKKQILNARALLSGPPIFYTRTWHNYIFGGPHTPHYFFCKQKCHSQILLKVLLAKFSIAGL